MFDDFFVRALFVGIGMALVTGPLGCFVVWRRLSFFGDTLDDSALLVFTIAPEEVSLLKLSNPFTFTKLILR